MGISIFNLHARFISQAWKRSRKRNVSGKQGLEICLFDEMIKIENTLLE
jgi:hypothetical protein